MIKFHKKLFIPLLLLLATFIYCSCKEKKMLHPDYPIIEGNYKITKTWSIVLPEKFNKRFENDSLVIWHPGFTMWIIAWNNDKRESYDERIAFIKKYITKNAYKIDEKIGKNLARFSYCLDEKRRDENRIVYSYNAFVFDENGHIQISIYYDDKSDFQKAHGIFMSITNN